MQQPGRDLCEFGERRLELALDRKLVLALVQTTPSGSEMAERQRREFVAAELHLDVDELVDGVPDVGDVVVVGRFLGPERPTRESVQRGYRRRRCDPGSGGDLDGAAGDDLLRLGAPSYALRDALGGPDDAWRRFLVALIGKVDGGGHRLARLGSERRRKGPWRQSSAQSSSRRLRRCSVPPPLNRVITFPTPFPYIASARRPAPSSAVSTTKIPSSSSLRRIRAIVLASAEISRPWSVTCSARPARSTSPATAPADVPATALASKASADPPRHRYGLEQDCAWNAPTPTLPVGQGGGRDLKP
jgi:hypothetical protein